MDRSLFNMCVRCDNIISNPLCNICLAKSMALSVSEQDQILAGLIEGFKGFAIDGETRCILCREKTGLCANCFSRDVYELIAEKNPALAKGFLGHFDFGLRKNANRNATRLF